VAVVVAAWLRRIPTILLEQNVIPGAANRVLARFARRVCVGFAETAAHVPGGRAVHTGNPIRAGLIHAAHRADPERVRILVFGGSAGARRLNRAMVAAVGILGPVRTRLAIVHQTGTADVESVRAGYADLGFPARVEPFITDMGAAYAASDLVLARAGAMTCAEVTAVGLPSILVPYPHAADDHQRRNAEVLERAGAARMILDHELDGERLAGVLRALIDDPAARAGMAERARALGRPDAAERVSAECLRLLGA
jgi:UDP-N-acetylglucosamine--N-acetylmuramyl-(pentapeptide) pyrophosphoryl-undecaprenol N-acetylglucosamine transferase